MKRQYDMESDVVFYHVIIKVPDNTLGNSAYAFDHKHKTYLRDLLFWLESIYELEVINYCIMSTHAHFVLRRERESKLEQKQVNEEMMLSVLKSYIDNDIKTRQRCLHDASHLIAGSTARED